MRSHRRGTAVPVRGSCAMTGHSRVHKCVPYKGFFRDVIKDRIGDSGHEAAGAMFVIWRAASPDLSLC